MKELPQSLSLKQRSHVIPLFLISEKGPELMGSGILLRARDHEIVVSAAHVFAKVARGKLCVPVGDNRFCALEGPITISSETLEKAEDETTPDLGYMLVGEKLRDMMADAGWGFLVTCATSLALNVRSFEGHLCVVQGFPNDHNTLGSRLTSVQITFPFYQNRILTRFGFDPQKYLGVRFQHLIRRAGEPVSRLWPECMSGGPLWLIDGERMKLAGIIAQYYPSKSLLLGTRIDLLLGHLNARGIDTSDAPLGYS